MYFCVADGDYVFDLLFEVFLRRRKLQGSFKVLLDLLFAQGVALNGRSCKNTLGQKDLVEPLGEFRAQGYA